MRSLFFQIIARLWSVVSLSVLSGTSAEVRQSKQRPAKSDGIPRFVPSKIPVSAIQRGRHLRHIEQVAADALGKRT